MIALSRRAFVASSVALAALSAAPVAAAQRATLIDRRWARFGNAGDPDHGAWDGILRRHLTLGQDGIARFNYRGADLTRVSAYVASLQAVDPATLNSNAAYAYWVNLYNAQTVKVVMENYPVRSIRDIGGGVFARGPWRDKAVTVAGQALSLDDIEHGILRPVWRDPRVHYAVNCASLGCPNLAPRAFTAGRLAQMLEDGARTYINHPRGARIANGRLIVSSIYNWFREDFGGSDAGVLAHLRSYAVPPIAGQLTAIDRISDHGYDWSLNG